MDAEISAARTSPELSVIVPTFNERHNVPELFARLQRVLAGVAFEMIVVDDDSPDGTAARAKEIAAVDGRLRVIRRIGRRGLAGACIEGMLASAADIVAVMDADLQHDETILPTMLDKARAGADLVVASRNIEGGSKDAGLTAARGVISDLGKKLSGLILKAELSDPMSGFFMMRRAFFEEVAPRLSTSGFKILADIAASTPRAPVVAEVAYTFRERLYGESKLDAKVALDYLGFLLHKFSGGLLPVRFIFFALVGLSGVVVHFAALWALHRAGIIFDWAQAGATFVAMTSNFWLNNLVTYRDARLKGAAFATGLLLFYLVCSVGALANVGVAGWLYAGQAEWWLAGLAGAIMGAVWNYAVSSTLVWRR